MAPGSCAWQNLCNNPLANLTGEQDELVGPQSQAERLDASSDKASTPPEALIPPFIPPTKDFFTKFMKAFMELTQAWDRE